MYYFNLLEVFKKNQEFTTGEIHILYYEKFGYGNRQRIAKVLKQLVREGHLQYRVGTIPHKGGRYFFYKLNI